MFLELNHRNLDVYRISLALVRECYGLTAKLPSSERFALTSQIRRAALSVHLNIAEGSSRRTTAERKRFFEIARGSVVEIDAALDAANELSYVNPNDTKELGLF